MDITTKTFEEVIAKIPCEFYPIMKSELAKVFGKKILNKKKRRGYNLSPSTVGWFEALKNTCKQLDLMWLYDFSDSLPWDQSDEFDAMLEQEMIRRIFK